MAKKLSLTGRPRKFTGELAEPIVEDIYSPIGALTLALPQTEEAADRVARDVERRILRRRLAKVRKLLAFYNIDPKSRYCWLSLSMALAIRFVPGMRVCYFDPTPRRGRPRKWEAGRETELVNAVDRIKAERRKGVADAIRVLQVRESDVWGFADRTDAKKRTASLQARYYEARQHLRCHDRDSVNVNEK